MNTTQAFANGAANADQEPMVFDWEKAARLIADRKPAEASAGLHSDWEWTGGTIYRDGEIAEEEYTYLSSTWATPELDMDGEVVDCFRMQNEVPEWNHGTKWPDIARAIITGASGTPAVVAEQHI